MKVVYFIAVAIFFGISQTFAQCGSCDITVTVPDAGNYNVGNNETLCLVGSGEFTGNVNLNNNNSELCISDDVLFTGNLNMNSSTSELINYGTISGISLAISGEIENLGTMILTGLQINSGAQFNNENTTFGSVEVNGNVIVDSGADVELNGGMVVNGNLTLNSGSRFELDGAGITISGTLTANNGSRLTGEGNTAGCEGVTFGSIVLNQRKAIQDVDVCNSNDPSSTGTTSFESSVTQCNCSSLLPVEFVSYSTKVDYEEEIVKVMWTTATELNSASYEIERSTNGYDFISIGNVAAAGNSEIVRNYAFYDNAPVLGRAYYRIKQIDIDGTFTYTNVMVQYYSNINGNGDLSVSINQGQLQLNFPAYIESGQLEIINSLGQTIDNGSIEVNAFSARLDVPLSGFYILRFSNRQNTWIHKVYIE